MRYCLFLYLCACHLFALSNGENALEKDLYHLRIQWHNDPPEKSFSSQCVGTHPIFNLFDQHFFMEHTLPHDTIAYRNNTNLTISGSNLKNLVDQLFNELMSDRPSLTDFIPLRPVHVSRLDVSQIAFFRFKNYPFVVKMFIQTPQSLAAECNQNLIQNFLYLQPKHVHRCLVGLTRIKNLTFIDQLINQSPTWASRVTYPRKWFLVPEKTRWICMESYNAKTNHTQTISFPGTFCIIEDYIESSRPLSHINQQDCSIVKELCRFIGPTIDPNLANFLWEKETGKLALIDTEDFRLINKSVDRAPATCSILWITNMLQPK